jgi:hypothetical protein
MSGSWLRLVGDDGALVFTNPQFQDEPGLRRGGVNYWFAVAFAVGAATTDRWWLAIVVGTAVGVITGLAIKLVRRVRVRSLTRPGS